MYQDIHISLADWRILRDLVWDHARGEFENPSNRYDVYLALAVVAPFVANDEAVCAMLKRAHAKLHSYGNVPADNGTCICGAAEWIAKHAMLLGCQDICEGILSGTYCPSLNGGRYPAPGLREPYDGKRRTWYYNELLCELPHSVRFLKKQYQDVWERATVSEQCSQVSEPE